MKDFQTFLKEAAHVKPSARQLAWYELGFYAFIHFSVNTYTGRQCGLGDEDPAIFNPTELDCDEWVETIKAAGMKGVVITAKHHDGFCLWPSKYTEHSVKNSPWKDGKGDVLRELSDACRRAGIKFGVYLSPWDRNSKYYGTPEYNDYYANQLTELLTEYGELFMVWQDNACGEGANGKKQEYDFPRFNALIRKYQPNAVIFNDFGPDVRWCGNEAGTAREGEWAVVPGELCKRAERQTKGALIPSDPFVTQNPDRDPGALSNIIHSDGLCFAGSEVDTSIRPHWFYVPEDEPRTPENIFDLYLRTVGGNTSLNLNIPPMPSGKFDPRDVAALKEFGKLLRERLGPDSEVPCTVKKIRDEGFGRALYEIKTEAPAEIAYVEIAENIAEGQRIESFQIRRTPEGTWALCAGLTVGARKICRVSAKTDTLYLRINARDEIDLKHVKIYQKSTVAKVEKEGLF
ncbi:MAG: alpha-L-fucosidase [Clostridia bacterium]|nr:alpha-L-fucosidase [Clostridia bacterium]